MREGSAITSVFQDIGGVLLSNGWDHHARRQAVEHFELDIDDFEERNHFTDGNYGEAELTLQDYLSQVVFHQDREVVYVENTAMFVQIAQSLGIRSTLHTDYATAGTKLEEFGLWDET